MSGFDYSSDAYHVEKRRQLAPLITQPVEPFRAEFDRDVVGGEARFWMEIHKGLLKASATLPQWCEQLLSLNDAEALRALQPRVVSLGAQLIHHAHGHHHIEDEHFFPVFLQRYPELANPIDLLEHDHEVLASVLDNMEKAVAGMNRPAGAGEKAGRDELLVAGEVLHKAALRLDRLFVRHIGDEEEICLPVLAQW